jgi:hypothetical protein
MRQGRQKVIVQRKNKEELPPPSYLYWSICAWYGGVAINILLSRQDHAIYWPVRFLNWFFQIYRVDR